MDEKEAEARPIMGTIFLVSSLGKMLLLSPFEYSSLIVGTANL